MRKRSGNNLLAIGLVQSAMPSLLPVKADFPALTLGVGHKTVAANPGLVLLDRLCQHRSPRLQAQVRMDIEVIRQLDRKLAAYGLQLIFRIDPDFGQHIWGGRN